jgi:hypothetical protein
MINTDYALYSQWPGELGVFQTVSQMVALSNQAYTHPYIRDRAASLVAFCKRNVVCENKVLTGWVNGSVNFIRDPKDTEALHDPVTFIEYRLRSGVKPYGDCDDLSMYLATLLKSIGHQPYFRIVDRFGSGYHHVMVHSEGMNLDPTMLGSEERPAVKELYFKV